MNKLQQEKLLDGKSILKLRLVNGTIVELYIAVDEDIDAIEEVITEIEIRVPFQKSDKTGVALDKGASALELAKIIDWHAIIACSYFMRVKDMTNYNKLKNYKLWMLKKLKPAELKIAASTVQSVCTTFVAELAKFRITALTIAKVAAADAAYEPHANEPKEVRVKSKLNTTSINDLFKLLTSIINFRFRGSLKAMEEVHPDLYKEFYVLTYEDKIGAHSHFPPSVITGNVLMRVSEILGGQALSNVSIRAYGFPEVEISDILGMAGMELPIGTQKIQFMCFDYQLLEVTITVVEGNQQLDAVMTLAV